MPDIPAHWSERLKRLRAEPSRDVIGDPNRLARVERTRQEMMGQGAAIRATLEAAAAPLAGLSAGDRLGRIRRVVITGCGDSWFVGLAVRQIFEQVAGLPCEAAQAFELANWSEPASHADALVVGISAGGNTPAVMAALQRAQSCGALTVGISNTPGSPITEEFDAALPVMASRKGWPTQSSTAAIALLGALAVALAQRQGHGAATLASALASLPEALDGVLAALDADAQAASEHLAAVPMVLFTGSGPDFAAACFGAAKVRELCPIHAFALPLEEMHHYRLPKAGDGVVILSTSAASRERALDTAIVARAEDARVVALLAGQDPDIAGLSDSALVSGAIGGPFAAALASAPLHALAYHLALRRDALKLGAAW
jgi:glucosamine--fructose-6-phosphate aminotransferase (isomerizing)